MKIAILGAGKLGLRIAEALLNNDSYDITIVDTNEDKLEQISQTLDVLTFVGDAKTSDTLKQIKIKDFDFLLVLVLAFDFYLFPIFFLQAVHIFPVI